MRSAEIRRSFIDFFVDRGHSHRPSSPLVPQGDPTLLFTNAGMVQFKNYFLGLEAPAYPRAVTAQKCLRVSGKHNDLENVGPSPRHHTFFEMLGNFSFGDYFKAEAIEYAWQLVTEVWGIPAQRLWASVFREDDEAATLWSKISTLPAERIVRCGEADNFWAMGDTGPCGPCSEIFIDRDADRAPVPFEEGAENGRYLELWNLVFMQFDRDAHGRLTPLPKPSIDTGAGLERVTAALQGVDSNYATDLFGPLLRAAAKAAGCAYGEDADRDVSLRVIADHVRAVSFLLADGVIPSNEGRGYVLRRILRRAVRHGLRLGLEEPFLGGLVPVLSEIMEGAYPELAATQEASRATLQSEEEKFLRTVATGAHKVQEAIEKARKQGQTVLAGDVVFRLFDTYGLPIDTLREIAEEERFSIDEEGFGRALGRQRERSRSATAGGQREIQTLRAALLEGELRPTSFQGYRQLEQGDVTVLRLARLGDGEAMTVASLEEGERGVAVLDRTVFYAESGGQVADRGKLSNAKGTAKVRDVQRDASGVVFHWLEVERGRVEAGAKTKQTVDAHWRHQAERHHTATHLLHAALREQLGEGVRQAGSLVHPERLRFDFTYASPLTEAEREAIGERVLAWIRSASDVEITERPYSEALAAGAMALFGEKYGDVVRTVEIPGISLELCGGCHVRNTGQIGGFVITQERGVASGVRRIEALAGDAADLYQRVRDHQLVDVEQTLGVPGERAAEEIVALRERLRAAERELQQTRSQLLAGGGGGVTDREAEVSGVKLQFKSVPAASLGELRNLADVLRQKMGSGVVVLAATEQDKVTLIVGVTQDLQERLHAGKIARQLGDAVGGSGGGRADFAQAGGKDPGRVGEAFDAAQRAIGEQLESLAGVGGGH